MLRRQRLRGPGSILTVRRVQNGRLDAAEAELEPILVEERPRKVVGARIAVGRLAFDRRTAGETEAKEGRHLVERLAGRVVAGAAEQVESEGRAAMEQRRVTAADDQADAGKMSRPRPPDTHRMATGRD